MSDTITIREVTSADYYALACFNANFPGDTHSEAEWISRFNYWWEENPAYDEEWKRGFLLLDKESIVGFVGSFPTFFKAGDSVVKAFNGTTWRVLEAYRKYSIDLWTYNREVSKHYISFNTTPTNEVEKMILRLKYFKFPWGKDCYSYIVGDPLAFREMLPGVNWLKTTVARLLKILQKIHIKMMKSEYDIRESSIGQEDVNELWQRTQDQWQYTNVRDIQSIQWYQKGKDIRYVYQGRVLVAFGIYTITKPSSNGSYSKTLVDFWCDSNHRVIDVLSALIKYESKIAIARCGLSMIKYPHMSVSISNALKALKLLAHDTRYRGYVRYINGKSMEFNNDNSYFCLLQGDMGS